MSSAGRALNQAVAVGCIPEPRWYAVQTRPRHEKRVTADLQLRGIESYLPTITETHRWSDRRKNVDVPLFSNYAFVRIVRTPEARLGVLKVNGVFNFVGDQNVGEPIPDAEIEAIRSLLASDLSFSEHTFLAVGQKVRIHGGALDGVEGILTAVNGSRRLVVSIETIQRSISVSVEGYGVEVLESGVHRA